MDEKFNLGYAQEDGSPLCVGHCCVTKLRDVVLRVMNFPLPYEVPPKDARLWRYMDFTKFVSLLSKRGLFFCRADKLSDPFEGAKGRLDRKQIWEEGTIEYLKQAIVYRPPPLPPSPLSPEEVEKHSHRLVKELGEGGTALRKSTFLSCWHENESESEAMWTLYALARAGVVAIVSSFDRLYRALGRDPDIKIGRVQYVDYGSSFAAPHAVFWRKRLSFQHEHEVRAIVSDPEAGDIVGKTIPCDLDILIDKIYVAPEAPPWLADLTREVSEKFGVDKPVVQSDLVAEPFY